jgi:hypothetical protein
LLTYHSTTVEVFPPATVAVNCSDVLAGTGTAGLGAMPVIAAGARMVMVAVAVRLVCAWAIAVMVTISFVG